MLTELRLCKAHRERVSGPKAEHGVLRFERGVNVLIGPNGSGKSSVLDAIFNKCKECKHNETEEIPMTFFDSEKQNPRIKHHIGTMAEVASRWCSHGEVIRQFATQLPEDSDLVMIDEPEAALDLNGVLLARGAFEKFVVPRGKDKPSRQLLVATHHPLLWFGNVITLGDDPKYMASCMAKLRKAIGNG